MIGSVNALDYLGKLSEFVLGLNDGALTKRSLGWKCILNYELKHIEQLYKRALAFFDTTTSLQAVLAITCGSIIVCGQNIRTAV